MTKFIDANIIVYAAIEDPRTAECRLLLRDGGSTNALALAEAFDGIHKITKKRSRAEKAIAQSLDQLEVLAITRDDLHEAMKIEQLRIFDAIHAVTAKGMEMVSFDKKLKDYCEAK